MNQELKDKRINEVITLFTSGMVKECVVRVQELISLYYDNEPFLFNLLGVAYAAQADFKLAISSYKTALGLEPNYYEAYNNMGVAYNDWKKPDTALSHLRKAIEINPQYSEAFNNIGNSYKQKLELSLAIQNYKKAIEISPTYVDAMCNLGICLALEKRYEQAKNVYKKAITLDPSNKQITFLMSDCLFNMKSYKKAKKVIYKQLQSNKLDSQFNHLLGKILHKEGDRNALGYYRIALNNERSGEEVLNNMGAFFFEQRKLKCSEYALVKALNLNKKNFNAKLNLAYTQLIRKNFKQGWYNQEFRWKADFANDVVWPIKDRELWEGQRDKNVLLWKEQGIGDDILFMGLVPEASEITNSTTVYTDPRLISLCERGMPGVIFKPYRGKIEDEEFDYHLPMGSLPRLFRNSEKDFERVTTGYLKADPKRVEDLSQELGIGNKKVIGISWKSFKGSNMDNKNIELEKLSDAFGDLDVVLLNLQYGDVNEEIRDFTKATGIEVLQCKSVDNREDLDGLAALIENCDLVVSTSNVTIHLAGALGKETWVLLPYVANFWWLLDRTDSVWYPTLKLYRQKKYASWYSIIASIAEDLNEL